MFSSSGFFATAARRTVVAFVVAGLMLPPWLPLLRKKPSRRRRAFRSSKPGAVVERDPEGGPGKKPPITLKLPEQAQPDQGTPPGLDRNDGETPPDDGGFGTLTEEDAFPFAYERLSHASTPKLTPNESTGALSYSIPIIAPPGRNGLDPKLELVYDSGFTKNEYLGLGWTTNIPYIERINRTGAENLYDDNYFFSSFDGELRAATSSMEEMSMGGGGFLLEEAGLSSTESASALAPRLQHEMETISEKLEGKNAAERADIKSDAVVTQLPTGEYQDPAYHLTVEVQSVEKIDGGLQIFARAWKGEEQLGFGSDGSVEVERFRIFNPPILIDDPNGDIVREYPDPKLEI